MEEKSVKPESGSHVDLLTTFVKRKQIFLVNEYSLKAEKSSFEWFACDKISLFSILTEIRILQLQIPPKHFYDDLVSSRIKIWVHCPAYEIKFSKPFFFLLTYVCTIVNNHCKNRRIAGNHITWLVINVFYYIRKFAFFLLRDFGMTSFFDFQFLWNSWLSQRTLNGMMRNNSFAVQQNDSWKT